MVSRQLTPPRQQPPMFLTPKCSGCKQMLHSHIISTYINKGTIAPTYIKVDVEVVNWLVISLMTSRLEILVLGLRQMVEHIFHRCRSSIDAALDMSWAKQVD